MADQSDTLASSQLFICLELLLLLANILTLVEITLQSTTYTPGAQLVLVASLKWLFICLEPVLLVANILTQVDPGGPHN